jgi:Thrombospondin type 3 repeat
VGVNPGLPVQAGDYLAGQWQTPTAFNCSATSGSFDRYLPVLADGGPFRPPTSQDTTCEVLIQATIEPDADADRLGDETQDPDDDNDGVADATDNCPSVPNPDQLNTDGAPQGNACDGDDDNDGDGDSRDNCPLTRNPNQRDTDGDGLGDVCDPTPEGVPTPVLGREVVADVVSGTVTFAPPPGSARAAGAHASQKGRTFIPLEEPRAIPVGSFLNTRRGTVQIISATNTTGGTQAGKFSRGLFQVLQSRARRARGLTEMRLKGGNFRRCRRGRGGQAGAAQVGRRPIRRGRANTSGRWRARGRNSAGTSRGTVWITTDRCDGTLTTVKRGRVAVRDFRRKKTIIVRAGKRYLARAPQGGRR